MMSFRRFSGSPSKKWLFVMEAFKWAPEGFFTWMNDRSQSPVMVQRRKNKMYMYDVAAKLVNEKKKELKDGTPRKDVLSVLGSSALLS